jgi:hypothetical protein
MMRMIHAINLARDVRVASWNVYLKALFSVIVVIFFMRYPLSEFKGCAYHYSSYRNHCLGQQS